MEERYVLYPEVDPDAFLEICKAFESDFPHFEKHKLLHDFLDGEYFQIYTYEDKKITFKIALMWDEDWIEVYANFDIFRFVWKVKSTILCKTKIDINTYKTSLNCTHGCYFIVNKTNDEKLIRRIANHLMVFGCTVFSFYGKYADLWHNVFDEMFVTKHYTEDDDKIALTVTAETLQTFAEDIACNVPSLKSFEYHCRVLYYDDETQLSPLQSYLKSEVSD